MKSLRINLLLAALTLPWVLFTGCKKEYGPDKIPNFPVMDVAPVPKFTVDPSSDLVIIEPEEFKTKFTLDLYFPDDEVSRPQSADISIVMNNDYKSIKKVKTGITSFPTTMELTGPELAELFNIDISEIIPGTKFELRADFTMDDGRMIPGFVYLDKGNATKGSSPSTASSDVNNWPDSKTNIIYNAVCPIEIDNFVGDVSIDDPYFYEGEYEATMTLEGDYLLRFTGLNENPESTFLIKIDPKGFTATVEKQVVEPTIWGYTNLAVQGSGSVDACNNVISLTLTWTVDQGSFGSGDFILQMP